MQISGLESFDGVHRRLNRCVGKIGLNGLLLRALRTSTPSGSARSPLTRSYKRWRARPSPALSASTSTSVGLGSYGSYQGRPPLQTSSDPVVYEDASDARYAAAPTISLGPASPAERNQRQHADEGLARMQLQVASRSASVSCRTDSRDGRPRRSTMLAMVSSPAATAPGCAPSSSSLTICATCCRCGGVRSADR